MLSEEKIILTAEVNDRAYLDRKEIENHLDKIKGMGVKVEEFYGDKAYFRGSILKSLEKEKITPYIPVSVSAYKIKSIDIAITSMQICGCVKWEMKAKKRNI